jgi:hypothetical protein
MGRWTDIATWRGNGQNQGPGGMVEQRGLVLHIAVGWFGGTIAWQHNPASRVSSHFVVGREQGELAQMVDTATRAWTQGDGNGRWLSSENEGFLARDSRNPGGWERLSPWQVEANARILAKAHQVYGVPLRIATHPGERGLGHHSMDREWLDEQWGHDECPGAAIVAQKPAIVARAKQIVEGEDDMPTADEVAKATIDRLLATKVVSRVSGKEVSLVGTVLNGGYEAAYRGREVAAQQLALSKATHAVVAGQDPDVVFRAALAEHRAELVAQLGDDVADRVAARLTEQSSPEQVRQALREELGGIRLAVEQPPDAPE